MFFNMLLQNVIIVESMTCEGLSFSCRVMQAVEMLNNSRARTFNRVAWWSVSCTPETCLSSWRALIGPLRAGSTSADGWVYAVGVTTRFDWRAVWAIARKLVVAGEKNNSQSVSNNFWSDVGVCPITERGVRPSATSGISGLNIFQIS